MTKFNRRVIQVLENEGPNSSQFFRKNLITFCPILAAFRRKSAKMKGQRAEIKIWPTLLQSRNSWACSSKKSLVPVWFF